MQGDGMMEPLERPDHEQPVRTAEELRRRWRQLMGPWGFGGHSVWIGWFDADDRQFPHLTQIEELGDDLEPEFVTNLFSIIARCLGNTPAASFALLLSRPGGAALGPLDRRRAVALVAEARRTGVPMRPLHLATRGGVRPVTLDDLGAETG